LALGSTLAAWAEYGILRHRIRFLLRRRRPVRGPAMRLAVAALPTAVLGGLLAWGLQPLPLLFTAPFSLLFTGVVYVLLARRTGLAAAGEAAALLEKALSRIVRATRSANRGG